MKWISIKDELPIQYQYYLVLSAMCKECIKNKEGHPHRLSFKPFDYDVALWNEKDMDVVKHYPSQGDNSWDFCKKDHWSETKFTSDEITHWMSFPNSLKE